MFLHAVDLREILCLHRSCVKALQELFQAGKTLATITGNEKTFYTFFSLFLGYPTSSLCTEVTEFTLVAIISIKREIFYIWFGKD